MYTVLIVDDEPMAIEGIRDGVDWEALGVAQVLTAGNVKKAKECFLEQEIHVLLCDIEMPKENGILLLGWVRERFPFTGCVLLTCHSEFEYVQEALQQGAVDYILKPAPYENIAQVVRKAICRYQEQERSDRFRRHSGYWEKNRGMLLEGCWLGYLKSPVPTERAQLENQLRECGMEEELCDAYGLLLCEFRGWEDEGGRWNSGEMDFVVQNILAEVFAEERAGQVIPLEEKRWLILMPDGFADREQVRRNCQYVIELLGQHIRCEVCLYVELRAETERLGEGYQKLLAMSRDHIRSSRTVIFSDEVRRTGRTMAPPDVRLWTDYISQGEEQAFLESVTAYIDDALRAGEIHAEFLLVLYHNVMQVLYTALSGKNILAERLLLDTLGREKWERVPYTIEEFMDWMREMLPAVFRQMDAVHHVSAVIEKVNAYILEHIEEELRRDDLAEHVYLSPAYLSRLYKKETGIPITESIARTRLRLAKQLLRDTDLTVTAIAYRVGYNNMPYFSKTFRKETGMTPQEYRRSPK